MLAKKFEDLLIWQESRELVNYIYEHFRSSKDFGFRDQILRAVLSVMNNIAEGFERNSKMEFKRFLVYSKSSNAELRSMLYLAQDLKYLDEKSFEKYYNASVKLSKMISSFIKSL